MRLMTAIWRCTSLPIAIALLLMIIMAVGYSELKIVAFEDINENGIRDSHERGIPGWEFYIEGPDKNVEVYKTDENGEVSVKVKPNSAYKISENMKVGWRNTTTLVQHVKIKPENKYATVRFGNIRIPSEIRIHVFEDANADGKINVGERALSGWEFQILDPEGNRRLVYTNEEGFVAITATIQGIYTIYEIIPDGWEQTTPSSIEINVRPGGVYNVCFMSYIEAESRPLCPPLMCPSGSEVVNETSIVIKNETYYKEIDRIIKEELDSLPKGQILFYCPGHMTVGKPEIIEAHVIKGIADNISDRLIDYCEPQSADINVSTLMIVNLNGRNFEISSRTPEEQAIIDETTSWKWDVVPLKWGTQKLLLTVDLVLEIPGLDKRTKHIRELEREIEVKVNPIYFAECNWQWIFGGLVAIIGAFIKQDWIKSKIKILRKQK